MRTMHWKTDKQSTGKYHVRLTAIGDKSGSIVPGMILGGNGKWVIQLDGVQLPKTFRTLKSAAADLAFRAIRAK